jgi:hypothetical protein
MDMKETIHHQDGSKSHREYHIEMAKGKSQVAWTLYPKNGEETFIAKILTSGWKDHGQPMYHVLTEWGEYEETSYSHLNEEQLLERFPEFEATLKDHFQDIVVTAEEFYKIPNDGEIGRHIRRKSLTK